VTRWPWVAAAAALLLAGAPLSPALVERWFSTGAYAVVQPAVSGLSNRLPFAVLDVLLVAVVASACLSLWTIATARRHRVRTAVRIGTRAIGLGALAYLAFVCLWGLNYRRMPMTDRLALAGPPRAGAALALGHTIVGHVNRLHRPAHAAGWSGTEWRNPALRQAFATTQRMLTAAPLAEPGRLKPTILSPYFRWTGVDGMVNPFGLEVLANSDLLPFERPFVAAHEWAHLAGFADEAEANFVGWLTCVRADAGSQYSGWLFLYWQLRDEVTARERSTLDAALESGPREDLAAVATRLRNGQLPQLRRASWAVYDQYLKANRVEEGVRSYGAVISLVLRARFDEAWVPRRRS
jgi:hypothetical protein